MLNRYLQQELGLDPMTAEEAQRPPPQFPITPGAWGGQLREDMRREFLPQPGDTEDQTAFKAAKLFMAIGAMPKGSPGPGTTGILTAVGRVRPPHTVHKDLAEARQMEMSGYHPQEIWDRLGVARGADRFWREEMPGGAADPETLDAMRRVLNRSSHEEVKTTLGSAASKEFAATYPELMTKELTLKRQDPLGLGSGGYDPQTGNIFLHPGGALNLPGMFEHESQHGVQGLHGWNEGGSPLFMGNREMSHLPNETLLRIARFAKEENVPPDVAFSSLQEPWFRNYLRLAGETEARNAWRRLRDLSLRRQVPSRTEDIPRRYQDVKLPGDFVPPTDPYAGHWRSPLYESEKSLLSSSGNPNFTEDTLRASQPGSGGLVTQQWKPDPDQLKQIRRVQKWLELIKPQGGK